MAKLTKKYNLVVKNPELLKDGILRKMAS